MERSLTILLPIRHATESLNTTVHRMLDMLPDLTRRFEVLLVDDGVTEAESELAYDLARDYPQVRVVQSGETTGDREAAVRVALEQSCGDVVFLGAAGCSGHLHEIDRLWHTIEKPTARNARSHDHRVVPTPRFQLLRRGERLSTSQDGYKANTSRSPAPLNRPNFLGRLSSHTLED